MCDGSQRVVCRINWESIHKDMKLIQPRSWSPKVCFRKMQTIMNGLVIYIILAESRLYSWNILMLKKPSLQAWWADFKKIMWVCHLENSVVHNYYLRPLIQTLLTSLESKFVLDSILHCSIDIPINQSSKSIELFWICFILVILVKSIYPAWLQSEIWFVWFLGDSCNKFSHILIPWGYQ